MPGQHLSALLELQRWRLLACGVWNTAVITLLLGTLCIVKVSNCTYFAWKASPLIISQLSVLLAEYHCLNVRLRPNLGRFGIFRLLLQNKFVLLLSVYVFAGWLSVISFLRFFPHNSCSTFVLETGQVRRSLDTSCLCSAGIGAFCGFLYGLWLLLSNQTLLVFPSLQQRRWIRLRNRLPELARTSVLCTFVSVSGWLVVCYVFAWFFGGGNIGGAFRLLVTGDGSEHDETFLSHLCPSTASVLLCVASWRFSHHLLHIVVSQAVSLESTEKSVQLLLYGLSCNNMMFRYLAFLDARMLAQFSPSRRSLFWEEASGVSWCEFRDRCCNPLKNLTNALNVVYSPTSSQSRETAKSKNKVAIIRQWLARLCGVLGFRVFRTQGIQSRAVGSQGRTQGIQSRAVGSQDRTQGIQSTAVRSQGRTQGIQSRVVGSQDRTQGIQSRVVGSQDRTQGIQSTALGSQRVVNSVSSASASSIQYSELLCDLQLFLWSLEALGFMLINSRKEDRLGVVQNSDSIRLALICLCECLTAVEKLVSTSSPVNLPRSFQHTTHISATGLVRPELASLHEGLVLSIYNIVTAFFADMPSMRFPPLVVEKLQGFMKFSE